MNTAHYFTRAGTLYGGPPRRRDPLGAKSVCRVAALPKNAYGKIVRRELREPFWATRERRVN